MQEVAMTYETPVPIVTLLQWAVGGVSGNRMAWEQEG